VTGACVRDRARDALALAREGADLFLLDIDAANLASAAEADARPGRDRDRAGLRSHRAGAKFSAAGAALAAEWGGLNITDQQCRDHLLRATEQ